MHNKKNCHNFLPVSCRNAEFRVADYFEYIGKPVCDIYVCLCTSVIVLLYM